MRFGWGIPPVYQPGGFEHTEDLCALMTLHKPIGTCGKILNSQKHGILGWGPKNWYWGFTEKLVLGSHRNTIHMYSTVVQRS